jgi:hypothetical protein
MAPDPPPSSLSPPAAGAAIAEEGQSPLAGARPWRDWRTWLGGLLSLALLAAILAQLGRTSADALEMLSRLPPAVWLLMLLAYAAQPLADYAIFRRLWRLPRAGLVALARKNVINEIVFGYSGEVYFYLWARRQVGLETTAFGAVKDVSLLSGVVGNLVTLALVGISAARMQDLDLVHRLGPFMWAALIPVTVSAAILAFARRVFSLPPRELGFITAAHALRLAAASALAVLAWRTALPEIGLNVWVALLSVRLLVARIPFVTNKELLFGNLVLLLAGPGAPVATLLASLAVVTLMIHLAVIAALGSGDVLRALVGRRRRR